MAEWDDRWTGGGALSVDCVADWRMANGGQLIAKKQEKVQQLQ